MNYEQHIQCVQLEMRILTTVFSLNYITCDSHWWAENLSSFGSQFIFSKYIQLILIRFINEIDVQFAFCFTIKRRSIPNSIRSHYLSFGNYCHFDSFLLLHSIILLSFIRACPLASNITWIHRIMNILCE